MLPTVIEKCSKLKDAISGNNSAAANELLNDLKARLIEFDSLPPLGIESASAEKERAVAREILEYAVILSIKTKDKEGFQRNLSSLRPYYTGYGPTVSESELKYPIIGLNLLYLLVENRLADFHCELELLTEQQRHHQAIVFCTQLDRHLMVGSYDQVMEAAAHPPVEYYSFFLTSLLETVRTNIAECAAASYRTLSVTAAKDILMFSTEQETLDFIADQHEDWNVMKDVIEMKKMKAVRADGIPAMKLVQQNLSYATELERIV
mmetsp:Transcript_25423/g.25669  ORF Transcript_25423/g.25669 Transcript_25423/m.25669 type:complete len:264 (+) Transcript_25423:197-988(+)|eukprot:CAMPEP_0182428750 /NCGR_PEP_ID=MMETSP1167-20130531/23339_1 /TAXON_ID=2988 /ORGANISM="Mallomonas Sp, Strain CCMP3275" /LENGTH=263 /DNA_ID=CAMNT_0024611815 /DNA_START=197 /DNA_END=988 /DNA_ORIENTATION=-